MADQIIPAPPALRRDAIGLREVLFQGITVGVIYLVWLYVGHPARVGDASRVHLNEERGAQAPAPDRVPVA